MCRSYSNQHSLLFRQNPYSGHTSNGVVIPGSWRPIATRYDPHTKVCVRYCCSLALVQMTACATAAATTAAPCCHVLPRAATILIRCCAGVWEQQYYAISSLWNGTFGPSSAPYAYYGVLSAEGSFHPKALLPNMYTFQPTSPTAIDLQDRTLGKPDPVLISCDARALCVVLKSP